MVDQRVVIATARRQQVRAEADKLSADLVVLRVELARAHATIVNVWAVQSNAQMTLQQRTTEAECSAQQLQDLTARLAEHEDFRRSLEDKLQHVYQALEYLRNASKEQWDQNARRREQQIQQLQAETRQTNQTLIVKQGEVTQLGKDGTRLATEVETAAKCAHELEIHSEQTQLTLGQARANRAQTETEHDALCAIVQTQVGELAVARTERENMVGEPTKPSTLLEVQQVMPTDYRTQLDVTGPTA